MLNVLVNSIASAQIVSFLQIDTDGSGYIEFIELRDALKTVGIDLPNYKVRDMIDEMKKADTNKDNKLSLDEFKEVI